MEQPSELKVFITTTDASCSECGEQLGRHAWITLVKNKGALCLSCADLDHLTFPPSEVVSLFLQGSRRRDVTRGFGEHRAQFFGAGHIRTPSRRMFSNKGNSRSRSQASGTG